MTRLWVLVDQQVDSFSLPSSRPSQYSRWRCDRAARCAPRSWVSRSLASHSMWLVRDAIAPRSSSMRRSSELVPTRLVAQLATGGAVVAVSVEGEVRRRRHNACFGRRHVHPANPRGRRRAPDRMWRPAPYDGRRDDARRLRADRKSTRLNSSHGYISYAVFCLKKKKKLRVVCNNIVAIGHLYSVLVAFIFKKVG